MKSTKNNKDVYKYNFNDLKDRKKRFTIKILKKMSQFLRAKGKNEYENAESRRYTIGYFHSLYFLICFFKLWADKVKDLIDGSFQLQWDLV